MVIGVMCSAINERLQNVGYPTISIVNGQCPDVGHHKEYQVQTFMRWEYEWINVVGKTLQEVDAMHG